MTPELMTYAIAGLAFVAIAGIGLVFAGGTGRGKQSKRLKSISDGTRGRGGADARGIALVEQALQHEVDVELAVVGVADADGDVLEIDEEGEPLLVLCADCQELPPVRGVPWLTAPPSRIGVPGGIARAAHPSLGDGSE